MRKDTKKPMFVTDEQTAQDVSGTVRILLIFSLVLNLAIFIALLYGGN